MNIELPKDAEGREIPLDTEVLFDSCGTKVSVKEFLFSTLVESQKTEWTIKAAYEGNLYYNSFKPKNMRLTQPDTWERLLEDLDRGAAALNYEACAYFDKSACDCSLCIADKGKTCERVAMRNIASRIRKLRGEDE